METAGTETEMVGMEMEVVGVVQMEVVKHQM